MDLRGWLEEVTVGQKGQTRFPPSECEADVREEVREVVECVFTGLWRLNPRPTRTCGGVYQEGETLICLRWWSLPSKQINQVTVWTKQINQVEMCLFQYFF
jgi:hypothetical protein